MHLGQHTFRRKILNLLPLLLDDFLFEIGINLYLVDQFGNHVKPFFFDEDARTAEHLLERPYNHTLSQAG